ncbi:MAG: hypothetical protein Q7S92_04555 [Candidatus Diapherotrites archaeon]|nr:hypothetical protein [Candidatus Diapherotrites archaeon]
MKVIVETTKMSTKGQVIIPKDARTFMELEKNTVFSVLALDQNTLILKKLDKEKLLREFENIRARVKHKLSEKGVDAIVHKARKG